MEHLTEARRQGWDEIQSLREQLVLCRTDARRRYSLRVGRGIERLRSIIKKSEGVAQEVRRSFAGLLEPTWIDEYLETRLRPFRDELADLDPEPKR